MGQAIASTLLTLLLGLPVAFLFARFDFPAKRLLRSLTTVPFVLPTVVVAVAFQALLGPAGPVNRLLQGAFALNEPPLQLQQTLTIILLAHIFYNLTIVVRLVGGFWANLSPESDRGRARVGRLSAAGLSGDHASAAAPAADWCVPADFSLYLHQLWRRAAAGWARSSAPWKRRFIASM